MIPHRLLPATFGAYDMGYTMTPDEVGFWQDHAALLDPAAYVYGFGLNETVPGGEHWYVVNIWQADATGAGTYWYHRPCDVARAHYAPEGTVLDATDGQLYYCNPSLVIGTDDRYDTDPRGLYFERIRRIATELEQFKIGTTNTGSGQSEVNFPTDFTNGFGIQTSVHDVAWLILLDAADDGGLNMHNEISDSNRIRWAEPTMFPFVRTTFPSVLIQGASQGEGKATFTYAKLPGDW